MPFGESHYVNTPSFSPHSLIASLLLPPSSTTLPPRPSPPSSSSSAPSPPTMVRAPQKALKIGRAIKSAARYPVQKVSSVKGGSGNSFSPLANEVPIVVLKVQVLSCSNLLAKDKNGFSDPYVPL